MSDDVGTNREDDEERNGEKVCNTCMKRNIPKILYCGHVIWICQKCLSEANSDQICCPKCQSPLVDPLLAGNGGGNILQENLFTDLFQDEEYDKHIISHERSIWCSLPHEGNIPSVSFCRLCTQMLCQACSDLHPSYHFLQNLENIRSYLGKRDLPPCLIHSTDSTHFCSTHSVPICQNCNNIYHTECSVKGISEELAERKKTLLSKYSRLQKTESYFRKELESAMKHQENKNIINDEFKQLVKDVLEMRLERKFSEEIKVLKRKLSRVSRHKSLVNRAFSSPPTPAFFDMTPTLQVLCDNVVSDTSVPDDMTLERHQDDICTVRAAIKRLRNLNERQQKDVLHFDKVHGRNIQLSVKNKLAQRLRRSENGIVFSSQPMEYDKLYQVKVLNCGGLKGTMQIGVCWKDAHQAVQSLPPTRSSMLKSSVIIGAYWIWKDGKKEGRSGAYGKKLNDVRERSIVGIAIRSLDCRLHLYIDGVDCGPTQFIFPKERNNLPHAVFDVRGKVKTIRALPLKKVSMYSPTLPCGITRCMTCEQINSACSISGPRGGLNLTSTGFSCHSKNVVYVVTCNKCNMLYVGETRGTIRKRCNGHRTNNESSVCEHVSKCGSRFSIAGVFKVKQDEDEQDEDEEDEDEQDEDEQDEDEEDEQKLKYENQRKAMETILILKLGTLQPSGLNKEK